MEGTLVQNDVRELYRDTPRIHVVDAEWWAGKLERLLEFGVPITHEVVLQAASRDLSLERKARAYEILRTRWEHRKLLPWDSLPIDDDETKRPYFRAKKRPKKGYVRPHPAHSIH